MDQLDTRKVWLRCYEPRPGAALRLVCLPHAGGAATFFRGWSRHLPPGIETLAVCYPGRQERIAEPCVTSMTEMADRLARALAGLGDRPLALFGHSMGAVLGYETARRLEEEHGIVLTHLFVSGIVPPHQLPRRSVHLASDDALVADVVEAGAGDGAVLADPDFREMFLPSIRADYRLIETYRPSGAHRLTCPVTGCHGDDDEDVLAGGFEEWGRYASRPVRTSVFPGGHFYLQDNEPELVHHVARTLLGPAPAATRAPGVPDGPASDGPGHGGG